MQEVSDRRLKLGVYGKFLSKPCLTGSTVHFSFYILSTVNFSSNLIEDFAPDVAPNCLLIGWIAFAAGELVIA